MAGKEQYAMTAIDDYIQDHISPEHPYLYRLYRATNTQLLRPRMASGHQQGLLLRMICQMLHPMTVVEIGTYSGYSALAMASGMPAASRLYTFEINDEQEDFTRPWIEGSPWADRVSMIIGDVEQLLPDMHLPPIDLVFIDANKRDYVAYYQFLRPMMRPGGWMIADNTLWDGHVTDHAYDRDAQTIGIRAFNDLMAAEARAGNIETNILPLRDGLTIIRIPESIQK